MKRQNTPILTAAGREALNDASISSNYKSIREVAKSAELNDNGFASVLKGYRPLTIEIARRLTESLGEQSPEFLSNYGLNGIVDGQYICPPIGHKITELSRLYATLVRENPEASQMLYDEIGKIHDKYVVKRDRKKKILREARKLADENPDRLEELLNNIREK